ncbi:MAG: SMI1/KNR4 family protein [Chitinophagaceae bacterium]|nr:MAG: SMI1/KNR4 family protein [Chitinophagaceae bacterium]
MPACFNDFNLPAFWDDSVYAMEEYVMPFPSDELIRSVETELGYRLPDSYITLMKLHNGGIPVNTCFPTRKKTSWADDHVAIEAILGIGRSRNYSLCGGAGNQLMLGEWDYPRIGIYLCPCPSAGHDIVMLDYRKCGPQGEPAVVHVDQENDYRITFLARDFESFVRGLVHQDIFDAEEMAQSPIRKMVTPVVRQLKSWFRFSQR